MCVSSRSCFNWVVRYLLSVCFMCVLRVLLLCVCIVFPLVLLLLSRALHGLSLCRMAASCLFCVLLLCVCVCVCVSSCFCVLTIASYISFQDLFC